MASEMLRTVPAVGLSSIKDVGQVRGRARDPHLVRDIRDGTALLDPADQRQPALNGQTCIPMLRHEAVSCGRWLRTPRFHTETASPSNPRTQPFETEQLGGRRCVFSVNTERIVDDADGVVRALEAFEVELLNGRYQTVGDSEFELKGDLALLEIGFGGPSKAACAYSSASASPASALSTRIDAYHPPPQQCLCVRRYGPRAAARCVGD